MRRSVIACGLLLALAGIPSAVATAAGGTGQLDPTVAQPEVRAQSQARGDQVLERRGEPRASCDEALAYDRARHSTAAVGRPAPDSFSAGRAARRPRVAPARGRRVAGRAPPAEAPGLELHPPLRGQLDGSERTVLGRSPDGLLLPERLRPLAPAAQGNRRPLDAAPADLGRREGVAGPRFLALAEHGSRLRRVLETPVISRQSGPLRAGNATGKAGGVRPEHRRLRRPGSGPFALCCHFDLTMTSM